MREPEPICRDSTHRTASSTHYGLLDVGRGVACLMVVFFHAGFAIANDTVVAEGFEGRVQSALIGFVWRLNLGVPLFFVISGYCIGASADASRQKGRGALRFLARRFWRIYPPYWSAVVLFVAVTGGLDALGLKRLHDGHGAYALQLDSPGKLDAVQWIGNLTLTEQWRPLVWRPPRGEIYTRIAWSLCYEEQFYFLCFLFLWLARRWFHGAWAVATVVIVAVRVALVDTGGGGRINGSFFWLWHEFAIGLAVYWALNAGASAVARRWLMLILAAVAVLGLWTGPGSTPVAYSTPTAAGFGLLLLGLRRWDHRADTLTWLAPLRACGRRSYSIYLVHLPVCTVGNLWLAECGLTSFWGRALVMIPVVACAALGVSWAFYQGIERHFVNDPFGFSSPQPRRTATAQE